MTNVIRQCVRADGSIRTDDCMTIVLMLLHAGSDINMTTCEECCPLMVASLLKCPILVKFFLDHGANPGIRCKLYFCFSWLNHLYTLFKNKVTLMSIPLKITGFHNCHLGIYLNLNITLYILIFFKVVF